MKHVISATALTSGEHLAMCGFVFGGYRVAVDAGHHVGNFLPVRDTVAGYHALGVDCDGCIGRVLAHRAGR